jgi:hypothetical protein
VIVFIVGGGCYSEYYNLQVRKEKLERRGGEIMGDTVSRSLTIMPCHVVSVCPSLVCIQVFVFPITCQIPLITDHHLINMRLPTVPYLFISGLVEAEAKWGRRSA